MRRLKHFPNDIRFNAPEFYPIKELLRRNSKGEVMSPKELERIKKYEAAQRNKK